MRFAVLAMIGAACAPVLASQELPVLEERRHRLVYADARVRVLNVVIEPRSATAVHQHDSDLVWVALGAAKFADAVQGKPEAHLVAADGSVHFSPGPFAHLIRNEAGAAFHIVTLELLAKQTHPRNLCDAVVAGSPMNCSGQTHVGQNRTMRPAFETDQTRAGILRVEPGTTMTLQAAESPPVVVALTGTAAQSAIRTRTPRGFRSVWRQMGPADILACPARAICRIQNAGKSPAQFLVLEFTIDTRTATGKERR